MKNLLSLLFCFLLISYGYSQQAGSIDSTFNDNGNYTYDSGFHGNVNDVKVQPDKKIVCTAYTSNTNFGGELRVLRLNDDGTMDSSFGNDGIFSLLVGNETYGFDSHITDDGKIIVAGLMYDSNFEADWLLIRLNEDGTLDTSFGTDGMTILDFMGTDDIGQAMAVQRDGKILLSGVFRDTTNFFNTPAIVRFTENGIVDSTFGEFGKVSYPAIGGDNELTSIVVQEDGKIVASGHYSAEFTGAMDFDVFVMRVDRDGVLDPTFGESGVAITPVNGGIDDAFGMALDQDQNIVVAGFTTLPFTLTFDMILLKYTPSGLLDSTFGTNGIVSFDYSDEDVANDVVIQADNKIVVAGAAGLSFFGPRSAALWRYLPDGSPDNTFGDNGFIRTDINTTFQDYNAITIAPNGKIVCGGRTNDGTRNNMLVVRYLNDLPSATENISTDIDLSIFPNPVSAGQDIIVRISNELLSRSASITLTDISGKQVSGINLKPATFEGNRLRYHMPASLHSGVYFLTITSGNLVQKTKIVVR